MPTRYRTAFLDAGGVLVCPNWQRASDVLARHGVIVEPAAMAAAEPAVKRQLDVGRTVQRTNDEQRGFLFFDLILMAAGVQLSERTRTALAELKVFHDAENAWDFVPAEVEPALKRLREAGLQTVVVSNSNGTIARLFARLGLDAYLDVVVDSAVEGVEKPDPRLFRVALERSGADPSTTIHCGDLYEIDVLGARAAGLPVVLLDTAGMYAHVDDCPRVRSLGAYVDGLLDGRFD